VTGPTVGTEPIDRDGEGLDAFYERHGYREVGRHPAAVRVGDGYRDEVLLVAPLR